MRCTRYWCDATCKGAAQSMRVRQNRQGATRYKMMRLNRQVRCDSIYKGGAYYIMLLHNRLYYISTIRVSGLAQAQAIATGANSSLTPPFLCLLYPRASHLHPRFACFAGGKTNAASTLLRFEAISHSGSFLEHRTLQTLAAKRQLLPGWPT